ncbi:hypothetical protein ACIBI9_56005 [Nonomuraea sp. NPDC050451]|uniref:hypothetical protein n=1 Tax=Nonomuraea sp. NPDC050451 TaxID=3364364 RepID=UPI0037B0FFE1
MDRIDTVKVPKALPRPAAATDVANVLAVICSRRPRKDLPLDRLRDRVLFEAVRRCLGHASTETTQLYALPDDKVADAETAGYQQLPVGCRQPTRHQPPSRRC